MIKIENLETFGWESNIPDFPNYTVTQNGDVYNKHGVKSKPSVRRKTCGGMEWRYAI